MNGSLWRGTLLITDYLTLKMEEGRFFKMLISYHITRRHNIEHLGLKCTFFLESKVTLELMHHRGNAGKIPRFPHIGITGS